MRLIQIAQAGVPGVASPGAGFEQPFEMLAACHERVVRMLDLMAKLLRHLPAHGADEQARQAARDVMRYFDLAAPLHHQDEEMHVFPALLARSDGAHSDLVRRLQQDHRDMEAGWVRARAVLDAVAGGLGALDDGQEAALHEFSRLYARHLQDEDGAAYPAARALMPLADLHAMSEDMMCRRGVTRQALSAINNIAN